MKTFICIAALLAAVVCGDEARASTASQDQAKPAAGEAAKPAAGEAAKPAAGEAAKPAAGDAAKPGAGEAAKPAAGEAAKPSGGEAADPAAGETVGLMPDTPGRHRRHRSGLFSNWCAYNCYAVPRCYHGRCLGRYGYSHYAYDEDLPFRYRRDRDASPVDNANAFIYRGTGMPVMRAFERIY